MKYESRRAAGSLTAFLLVLALLFTLCPASLAKDGQTEETKICKVYLDPVGGRCAMTEVSVVYGGEYGTLPIPAKDGSSFDGWYTAAEGGRRVESSETYCVRGNTFLYAHWTPEGYTLTFHANGGSCPVSEKTVLPGAMYGELPVPTRSGYRFLGWFTAKRGGIRVTEASAVGIAADHGIFAQWEPLPEGETGAEREDESSGEKAPVFEDVPEEEYYFRPVSWALSAGITNGTSAVTFSPELPCTRGQLLTMLWRADDCPEPESGSSPFADLNEKEYYYRPVLWALENGIAFGETEESFVPDRIITRSEFVSYLYRFEGKPETEPFDGFEDVPAGADFADAVAWAVRVGVTTGTSETTFSPNGWCTRAQAVTFLYRFFAANG